MADDQTKKPKPVDAKAVDDSSPAEETSADDAVALEQWSRPAFLWQVPTIIIAGGFIILGIATVARQAPENDFPGALDAVAAHLEAAQVEQAHALLTGVIGPHIDEATPFDKARYHALAADWTYLAQQAQEIDSPDQHQAIIDHYQLAADLSLVLSPDQLERWGISSLRVGRPAIAELRLADLDQMLAIQDADTTGVKEKRNNLARHLIEHHLRAESIDSESLIRMLDTYRGDSLITAADRGWAMAREAELRLRTSRPQEAINRLLLDIRRLEQQSPQPPSGTYGELYMLLGWAYYDLGEFTQARDMLVMAQGLMTSGEPEVGRIHVLLGRVAMAQNDLDAAFDHFDSAYTRFQTTDAYLPALLGRAEVQSIQGLNVEALDDYQHVVRGMSSALSRDDGLTAGRVAAGLIDRHDAALTAGRLRLALDYAQVAEKLYPALDMPHDLTLRLALTSRQVAENMVNEGSRRPLDDQQRDASAYFRYAGEYFLQRARALVASTTDVDEWAESLWLAADSFDQAGRHDRALALFEEYLAGRAAEPRRAEATFRLARLYQAASEWEQAIEHLEKLLVDQPRSPFASQSHVPLAQCYRAMGRNAEAEQHLLQVLAGGAGLGPESQDFRESLVVLGRMYHEDGKYVDAIERLDEAVQRYPDDARYPQMVFWLADAYRGRANELNQQRDDDPTLTNERVADLLRRRNDMLATARSLFAQVTVLIDSGRDAMAGRELEQLQRLALIAQGDCEYDLTEYEAAIDSYDRVARRYSDHHASLYALAQIVNCLSALGDTERARAAHERALARLDRLPADSFDAPDALLDRAAWQKWLQNTPPPAVRSASVN